MIKQETNRNPCCSGAKSRNKQLESNGLSLSRIRSLTVPILGIADRLGGRRARRGGDTQNSLRAQLETIYQSFNQSTIRAIGNLEQSLIVPCTR